MSSKHEYNEDTGFNAIDIEMQENPLRKPNDLIIKSSSNQDNSSVIGNQTASTTIKSPYVVEVADMTQVYSTDSSSITTINTKPKSNLNTFQDFITNLWNKRKNTIVFGIVLAIITIVYSILLSISISQSQNAADAPISQLDSSSASNHGWQVKHLNPPAGYNSPDSQLFGDNTVTLELTFNTVYPSNSGASIAMRMTLYLPPRYFDTTKYPPSPAFTSSCIFGQSEISVTPTTTISGQSISITYNMDTGTYLQYPLDSYRQSSVVYCTYNAIAYEKLSRYNFTNPATGYLNFELRIATSDVGLFSHTQAIHDATNSTVTDDYTVYPDDFSYYGSYVTDDFSNITTSNTTGVYIKGYKHNYYQFPVIDFLFYRATINVVFPVFLIIAMWMIVVGQTIVFLPFYFGLKKVDGNGIPIAAVGILFALPNIRNNLPGAPPVGAVIDFACYFWCLIIAVSHFVMISSKWLSFTLPKKEVKKE